MKWFVYLFSFYVLLLSGIPCNADDDCNVDEIVLTTTSGNTRQDNDHKPICPCSPFFACGTCHGVIVPDFNFELPKALSPIAKLRYFYTTPPLLDFPPSIWQPPKIA
ncbi:DUF6660 family protein [Chitinophaga sp.]|uniref:DUF6660 family protein n=1 Tax=Chitinophaga sp. TaxID=1869181 RepID=UPI0034581AE3